MLDLYFGLDATGFEKASEYLFASHCWTAFLTEALPTAHFHHILGPVLMVTYACLSNTLLLTGTTHSSSYAL